MSEVSGLGGSASSYYANAIRQLQQHLFNKVDANGDGSVTKSELDQAVTKAGGTTTSADALYAALDPNSTGSVSEQQFAQNLPLPYFSPAMGAQLISDHAQRSGTGSDPATQFKQNLFSQLDANGDGTLPKSELEQAVTAGGGTSASADVLYAQLDPNNTGSVSEQQFVANLPAPPPPLAFAQDSGTATSSTGGDSSNSAQDALPNLLEAMANSASATNRTGTSATPDPATSFKQNLFPQLDANGDGILTKSELEQAVTAAGGTSASADALYAQLDPNNTGSVSEQQFVQNLPGPHHHHHGGDAEAANGSTFDGTTTADNGSSAEDGLLALLQNFAPQAGTNTATSASDPLTSSSDGGTGTTTTALASPNADNAQAALQALLDNFNSSSQATATGTSGSSADDALLALLNTDDSSTSTATSAANTASSNSTATSQESTPASLFSKVSQQILALMLQIQSQTFAS